MPEATAKPFYLCYPFVKAALVTGKFKTIVQHPKYTDINEWVAMNLFDFFNNLNLFLGFVSETCTTNSCPNMSTGYQSSYPWIEKNGRLSHLPATTHIDYILTWIQNMLDEQTNFPTRWGQDFPADFPSTVKAIYRQMLHIFAHLYHAHFTAFLHTSSEAHFNSFFAHFVAFGNEFGLLDHTDLESKNGTLLGIGELVETWREMKIIV